VSQPPVARMRPSERTRRDCWPECLVFVDLWGCWMVIRGGFCGRGLGVDWDDALARREDRPAGFVDVGWGGRRGCLENESGDVGLELVGERSGLLLLIPDDGEIEDVVSSAAIAATEVAGRGVFCAFALLPCAIPFDRSGMVCAAMTASAAEVK
jgi:hypothetical protein